MAIILSGFRNISDSVTDPTGYFRSPEALRQKSVTSSRVQSADEDPRRFFAGVLDPPAGAL